MKKLLVLLLTLTMFMSIIPSVSASFNSSENNLITLLSKNNVEPFLFSAIFQCFVSFDTVNKGTDYKLRVDSDDDIVSEIQMITSQKGITKQEISACVSSFITYFAEKPEEFELFISFVINENNFILPMTFQNERALLFPNIADYIYSNFYGLTYAFNLIKYINDDYHSVKDKFILYFYDVELKNRDNITNYVKCLSNSDSYFNVFAVEKIIELVNFVNSCTVTERIDFNDFLRDNGLANITDESIDDTDDFVNDLYASLAINYSNGNEYISSFNNYETVANEYINKINNSSSADNRKEIISEALTKAAEIKLKNASISSNSVNTIISDSQFFIFAAVNAMMTKNEFAKNDIYISQTQEFDIAIKYPAAGFEEGYSLRIPSNIFSSLRQYNVENINIESPIGDLIISRQGIIDNNCLNSTYFTIKLRRGSASSIIPTISAYAQGSKVLSISFIGGPKTTDFILRDIMYYKKNVALDNGNFNTNNFYEINLDKTRTHVSDYMYADDTISFEIGNGRNFVYIEGKLEEPKISSTTSSTDNQDNTNDSTVSPDQQTTDKEETSTDIKTPINDVTFKDVPDSHWAKDYISILASAGIINGTGNGMFNPDADITREQFAKMLLEALGLYLPDMTSEFSDVDPSAWYAPYIACATKSGIILGIGDNIFGVGKELTRQDMSVMVVRTAKSSGIELSTPSDHEYNDYMRVADYALEPMLILSNSEVIMGFDDNTLRGSDFATRAQAAKIICKIREISLKE